MRSTGWSALGVAFGRLDELPGACRSGSGGQVDAGALVWIRSGAGETTAVALDQLRGEHFAGSVPWRRFRSRQGQAHLSGSYWAATTGGHVVYESRLELARLLVADFDAQVGGIWAQPCRLVAEHAGRLRHHVPDFLLLSPDGVVTVVNVKPAHRLADAAVAEALDWVGVLFTGHGWRYEIWSGCDPVMLDNVRFLAGYRRRAIVTDDAVDQACTAVGDGEQLAVVERRLAASAPPHLARPALLAALWRGRLTTDLSRILSGTSVLRRGVR